MEASTPSINNVGLYYKGVSVYNILMVLLAFPFVLNAQPIPVCSGLKDAYACPEEPVTPDPALLSFFLTQNASNPCFGLLEFDNFPGLTKCNGTDIPQNALFIHQIVFPVASGSIGFASLQFRAKASPSGQTNIDFISFFEGSAYLTGANLNQLVEAVGTWNPNQDASFTLDLGNLPSVFSVNSILQYLNDGDLDIVIGNETGVDWICLDAISDTCYCKDPSFTDLILHWDNGPGLSVSCETSYEGIPCPRPGNGYFMTGKFECEGDSCEMNPYVSWDLEDPSGNHHYGSSIASPYFVINLLPSQTSQNGIYTMSLTSFCGTDTCTCEFQFVVDCPAQCPCDFEDLEDDVDMGFTYFTLPNSCQACFTPIALTDCDSVNWFVTDTNGISVGSSLGNNMFCHTFPGSGTYTVFIEVTRKKSDGTICKTIRMSESVNIFCESVTGCDDSVFDNPTFSEGAIAGGFNSGGVSEGWTSLFEELEVVEGQPGSLDGWTIELKGNLDTAGILTTMDPVCLARDTGVIDFRFSLRSGTCCKQHVWIWHRSYQPESPDPADWDTASALQIATIFLADFEPGVWYDVSVPYDSRNWFPTDSCGAGVMVRPAVLVSNMLNTDQGGEDTYTYVQVDNFCMDGTIVSVKDIEPWQQIRIFPNPNTGDFTVDLSELTVVGTSLRIIGLHGQLLSEKKFDNSNPLQNVDASMLPEGMYILQIISEGRVTAVSKFVKM